jgi:hypothetical protein
MVSRRCCLAVRERGERKRASTSTAGAYAGLTTQPSADAAAAGRVAVSQTSDRDAGRPGAPRRARLARAVPCHSLARAPDAQRWNPKSYMGPCPERDRPTLENYVVVPARTCSGSLHLNATEPTRALPSPQEPHVATR